MSARIIDGKQVAAAVRAEIAEAVADRVQRGHRPPGLAVVLVGENPASQSYVRAKTRACQEAGFHSEQFDLPVETSEAELLDWVRQLNGNPAIDGILVQLPLPRHIDAGKVLHAIDPAKDVDGFHPVNMGKLATGEPSFVPCTPLGIRELLVREGVETRGKIAVIVGRSNIVGKPMALLLTQKGPGGNATVVVCHSATADLAGEVGRGDIVIAAMGSPEAIPGDWIKPGAVVIDVGVNRVDDATRERGYRLVGDVGFDAACERASAITPVPGGVGPMTIAMLLKNTLQSANERDPLG